MSENTALVKIEDPRSIFVEDDGVAKILAEVKTIVSPLVFDVGTAKGRADCASWAAKVARTKTLFDGAGKDLVAQWKEKSKAVDRKRRILRDSLDAIKASVRAPLTEFEEKQKRERAQREKQIEDVKLLGETCVGHENSPLSVEQLQSRLVFAESLPTPDDWYGDLMDIAISTWEETKRNLKAALIIRREAEREEKEERARRLAEQEARREKEVLERIEAEKKQAIEKERRRAAEALYEERKKAIKKARAEERIRAENERRIKAEAARKEQEKADRERDENNRKRVHHEIAMALTDDAGLSEGDAKKVVIALAQGCVPHVSVTY